MTKGALSILIADDDEGDRKNLRRILKKSDIECVIEEACDIPEVMHSAENQAFDCAILDYQMPGTNGLEGLALLRKFHPYMSIIMVTGQGDEMLASEAFKRGASDYIPKRSITEDSISHVIKNTLEKTALLRKVDEQRQALESFAHVLAHDLKAPIRHIRTFGEMLAEAMENKEYDEVAHFQERMDIAAERIEVLIDRLMQYNTLSGKEVELRAVSMQNIVENALDNLSVVVRERDASVVYHNLPEVIGDEPQLILLLQNLIGNGIKYCESDAPRIEIGVERNEYDCCFSVADNGIGIPEKYHKDIFSPFRRLHGSGEYEGAGLGLAICKKIVERHTGKIWCESQPDNGTTFFFTISRGQCDEPTRVETSACRK